MTRPIRNVALAAPVAAGLAFLAGCTAPQPSVTAGSTGTMDARRTLLLGAADGPVPLVIDRVPAGLGSANEVARVAAAGMEDSVRVTFVPQTTTSDPGRGTRVVLRFVDIRASDPGSVCAGRAAFPGASPGTPARMQAVLCDEQRAVADAVGVAAGPSAADETRLVQRTAAALVPRGFADSRSSGGWYGYPGVSIFGGVGSGNGGVGVGLGGFGVGF